jgi:hypothetical protein
MTSHSELEHYAQVEGLVGEEEALLRVRPEHRSPQHQERLASLRDDLDRAHEALRRRAHRLRGQAAVDPGSD